MRTGLRVLSLVFAGLLVFGVTLPETVLAREPDSRRDRSARDDDGHDKRPLILGHRGASGYRPEHTLASYELAILQGADYVEPDLVSTKDGVLIARHEPEIGGTTNVATVFPARQTTKILDGISVTGWFTEDFTLAEIKQLRARERLPAVRGTAFDGQFEVPTFQEVIDLVKRMERQQHRRIGIYPETKHPTYFDNMGLSLEEPLLRTLSKNGYRQSSDLVFIQSFEVSNLKELSRKTELPLIQLVDAAGGPFDLPGTTYASMVTPKGLKEIAKYANGIGANKNLIVPRGGSGELLAPTTLIRDAHKAGLDVHSWTFRSENQFLPLDFRIGSDPNAKGNAKAEDKLFFDLGVDGIFTDFPDTGVAARNEWLAENDH